MSKSTLYRAAKSIGYLNSLNISSPIIKLNSNELPFPHSPLVDKVLRNYTCSQRLSYYPDDYAAMLIEKIAQLNEICTDNILITAGSSEAIALAVAAFSEYNAEVLIPTHAFQLYHICARQQNRQITLIDETDQWLQNLQNTLKAITPKTQLIFLTNPSNPIGTWIEQNQLSFFLKQVPRTVTVLIDEAYFEFMHNESTYASAISYLNEYTNVIITKTFSKLYGLAGVRIGYAIGNPDAILHLKNYQLPYSVNAVAVECACKVLDDDGYYQACKIKIIETRNFLFNRLLQMGFPPLANSSNFLTFYCGPRAEFLIEELERQHIYVISLNDYRLPEYIRVSIGTLNEIQMFLKAFSEIMENSF